MRELLIQFIVPLTFLAIWALTSILNRDGQPLPQRPQRPGGPRPDLAAEEARRRREKARAAAERSWEGVGEGPSSAVPPRSEPRRPSPPPVPVDDLATFSGGRPRPGRPAPPRQPVPAGFDGAGVYVKPDEVVFLDPATGRRLMSAPVDRGRSDESTKPSAPPRQRKSSRRRASAGESDRSAESETRRALSDHVGRSMDLKRNQSLELKPLAPKLEGLTSTLSQTVSLMDRQSLIPGPAPSPIFDAHAIQDMFTERAKLREIAVLSEVLRPPVSLRRARGR